MGDLHAMAPLGVIGGDARYIAESPEHPPELRPFAEIGGGVASLLWRREFWPGGAVATHHVQFQPAPLVDADRDQRSFLLDLDPGVQRPLAGSQPRRAGGDHARQPLLRHVNPLQLNLGVDMTGLLSRENWKSVGLR